MTSLKGVEEKVLNYATLEMTEACKTEDKRNCTWTLYSISQGVVANDSDTTVHAHWNLTTEMDG